MPCTALVVYDRPSLGGGGAGVRTYSRYYKSSMYVFVYVVQKQFFACCIFVVIVVFSVCFKTVAWGLCVSPSAVGYSPSIARKLEKSQKHLLRYYSASSS